ncbi:H-NS histone family protein [Burkholderia ubonensis]|uniref:H-NS histone family protein n=1 Tax=Burkholderia ubonensis TaxID=101571 RepID=UPI00211CF3FB|nr:H-NS histone family protein [Burkholderia ubonensis]
MTKVVNLNGSGDYAWTCRHGVDATTADARFSGAGMLIYKSFMEKKALLEEQLEQERLAIAATVLLEVRRCIEEFGFSHDMVFPGVRARGKKRRVKYFNPQTGQSWSGVGREPTWLRGQDRSRFEIEALSVESPRSEES